MAIFQFFLSLMLIFLCFFGENCQETTSEEQTTTIWQDITTILSQEDIPSREAPSPFKFPKDRIPSGVSKRIIGGSVATPHEYPYQAALYVVVQGSLYFCGGTLLTTEWVLTAAHCVDGASSVLVLLGAHDISQVEPSLVTFNSSTFIMHESWDSETLQNDIALIRLPQNVTLNTNITTIQIAGGTDSYSGLVGRCLGWGKTILGSLSNVLRYVDAEIITNDACSAYTDYSPYIVDHHLCASGEGTVGSCNGDSGGPLLVDGIQVGIVSFGVPDCAAGLPSVYTRVTEFNSWIAENVENWNGTTGKGSIIRPLSGVSVAIIFSIMFPMYYL